MKNQCPACEEPLSSRDHWQMARIVRWRAPSPCPRCGTPIRPTSLVYLTNSTALVLSGVAIYQMIYGASAWTAGSTLVLAITMLSSKLATRLESAENSV